MFIKKLEYLMKKNNISNLFELSKLSGIPYTTLKGFYTRGTDKLQSRTISKLANFFECSTEYLTDDDIPIEDIIYSFKKFINLDVNKFSNNMLEYYQELNNLNMKQENLKKNQESNIFPIPDEIKKLPVIGKISAGLPILATENIIDYAFAPSSYIKSDYNYFYLLVQGDSMNRKFNDGDYILVQQQDTLENDEIGVFLIEDEATVKRYKAEDGIIKLYPMSTNPIHEAQFYDPKRVKVKIIGKVISYQGKI